MRIDTRDKHLLIKLLQYIIYTSDGGGWTPRIYLYKRIMYRYPAIIYAFFYIFYRLYERRPYKYGLSICSHIPMYSWMGTSGTSGTSGIVFYLLLLYRYYCGLSVFEKNFLNELFDMCLHPPSRARLIA